MSRRPATCLRTLLVAPLAAIVMTGCGGDGREAPAPPPIAAKKPAEQQQPAPIPSTPAPAQQAPVPASAPPVEAPPAAAPAYTPGTSLPGAIPPAPDPNARPPQKPVDPIQWLRDSEARKADYQRRLNEAQADAQNAMTNAEVWQRNALAFKNPFLARPQLSPEDSDAIAGMSGSERVRWSEGKLAEAQAASNAAQKKLDELKANPPLN